jgi:uncharacterized protein YbcI
VGAPVTRPSKTSSSSEPAVASGAIFAEISRSLVRLHKECYGKGPTKARTYASGDLVVCILEGGFTAGERTLRAHGREDAVIEQREAFQDALRYRFIETVEELVGRKVVTFISGVDPHTETSAELFVLESPDHPEVGDDREALANWGDQVRRQARSLRDGQASLRDMQNSPLEQHESSRRSMGLDGDTPNS